MPHDLREGLVPDADPGQDAEPDSYEARYADAYEHALEHGYRYPHLYATVATFRDSDTWVDANAITYAVPQPVARPHESAWRRWWLRRFGLWQWG